MNRKAIFVMAFVMSTTIISSDEESKYSDYQNKQIIKTKSRMPSDMAGMSRMAREACKSICLELYDPITKRGKYYEDETKSVSCVGGMERDDCVCTFAMACCCGCCMASPCEPVRVCGAACCAFLPVVAGLYVDPENKKACKNVKEVACRSALLSAAMLTAVPAARLLFLNSMEHSE